MKIDKEIIVKVAKNAQLKLEEKDLEKFLPQLNDIVDYFKILDEVETNDIEPCFHPIEIKDVMRDDVVEENLSKEESLKNAEHKKEGYFKGPKVV